MSFLATAPPSHRRARGRESHAGIGSGRLRIETFRSPAEARATLAATDDEGSIRVARGRRLLSIWASPRGQAGFDRVAAERAQELLMGSSP